MRKKAIVAAGIACQMFPIAVMANEGSGSVGTANAAVVDNLTNVANDMVATGNSLIPVALTVVTLSMVIVFGIKFFKRIIGKS